MTIETASWIDDLEPLYPVATDAVNEGDDHIRLIKTVTKDTLVQADAIYMVRPNQTGGIGNEYTIIVSPTITSLPDGSVDKFFADRDNPSVEPTLTIDGLATIPLYIGDEAVKAGEIQTDKAYECFYDGTALQVKIINKVELVPTVTFKEVVDNGNATISETIDWSASNMHELRAVGGMSTTLTFTDPTGPASRLVLKIGAKAASGTFTLIFPASVTVYNSTWDVGTSTSYDDIIELAFDGTNYHAKVYERF